MPYILVPLIDELLPGLDIRFNAVFRHISSNPLEASQIREGITGGQGYLAAGRMADARELVSEMSSRGLSANKALLGGVQLLGDIYIR